MLQDLIAVFVLGLTSSFHCIGMCGGLSCSYRPVNQKLHFISLSHIGYITGRLFIYTLIGFALGLFGGLINTISPKANFRFWVAITAAVLMIVGGVYNLMGKRTPIFLARLFDPFTHYTASLLRRFKQQPILLPFFLGALSGFIPCGIMWVVELKAVTSTSPFIGVMLMLTLCLATTPSLLFTNQILTRVSPKLRYRTFQITYLVVIAMGIHLIFMQLKN